MNSSRIFKSEDKQKAHDLLLNLNVKYNSEEYKALKKAAKDLIREESNISSITLARIYDRYIANTFFDMAGSFIGRNKYEVAGVKVNNLEKVYKDLLGKIASHMKLNDTTVIDAATLPKLSKYPINAVKELLDICSFIEKNQRGDYQFKTNVTDKLADYFCSTDNFEDVVKNAPQLKK